MRGEANRPCRGLRSLVLRGARYCPGRCLQLVLRGRKLCGRGVAGWRWLDIRSLADALVAERAADWSGATVNRVVCCPARISGAANPSGAADQDVYLKALRASGSVDHIEYGSYISKVIKRPLATENSQHSTALFASARR